MAGTCRTQERCEVLTEFYNREIRGKGPLGGVGVRLVGY
jgi:hypothetical protein